MRTGGLAFTNTKDLEPEIGDVITYRIDNKQVTHRVIDTEDGCYVTKGDPDERVDAALVTQEQIVGTVIPYNTISGICIALSVSIKNIRSFLSQPYLYSMPYGYDL